MPERAGRLRTNAQFRKVLRNGRAAANRLAVLYVLRQEGPTLAGVTIPRRFGNAVVRNRARRQFWEAYRVCRSGLEEGLWMVFIPRQNARGSRFAEILAGLRDLLERLGLTR